MLGIGSVIGTGIFVLTAEAAQKAGPGMVISFIIAAAVCGVAGLCYAELAAMVPVAGSAYTYSYAVLGELVAWLVGWALILEYAVAASAVSVGWSGYVVGLLAHLPTPLVIPAALAGGPTDGGYVNLPAVLISLAITLLLVIGTKESARVNAVLVAIKLVALGAFVVLALPAMKAENFTPFAPLGGAGITSAAASIFFAYIGFDTVSTAAEETHNPQRNLPIGLVATLVVCTLAYVLVAASGIGAYGAAAGVRPARRNPCLGLDRPHGALCPARRAAADRLFAGGAGACAQAIAPSPGRQSAGPGCRSGIALRHPDVDLWPGAHLFCDGARRAAAGISHRDA